MGRLIIRKTLSGNEYWDTEEKRTIFVPNDQEPDFKYYDSWKELEKAETQGKFQTGEESIDNEEVVIVDDELTETDQEQEYESVDFNKMNIKELRNYAKEYSIEIPKTVKKKAELVSFIQSVENNEVL